MSNQKVKNPVDALAVALGFEPTIADVITGDEVAFHRDPKIILPEDMTFGKAFDVLERLQKDSETETNWNQDYLYRPNDGAHAAAKVFKRRYGIVLGASGMFQPAETRNIKIGVGQQVTVPWGEIVIPTLPGLRIVLCDMHRNPVYGQIFELHVVGPKKYQPEVEQLFAEIEGELRTNSIYRGKALTGSATLDFIDLSTFDPSKIIFSDDATEQLERLIHTPIRYADAFRRKKMSLKRTALLEGPFGTGKSSEGLIIAGIAAENGWTFIQARPGVDKVEDVLLTARLYQPAVVFVEDIDGEASTSEDNATSRMLEAFDGVSSKGSEIIVVMTTNHIERIHQGMMRPGRLDGTVHIGKLDRNSVERLAKAIIPKAELAEDVDFDAVYEAMEGFYPAFVRATFDRAQVASISRTEGRGDTVINTDDLVVAAKSLQPQLAQLEAATLGERRPTLDAALTDSVKAAIKQTSVYSGAAELPIRDASAE